MKLLCRFFICALFITAPLGVFAAEKSVIKEKPSQPTPAQAAVIRMIEESHAKIFSASSDEAAINEMKTLMTTFADMDAISLVLMGQQKMDAIKTANQALALQDIIKGNISGMYTRRIRRELDAQVTIKTVQSSEKDPVLGEDLAIVSTLIHTKASGNVVVEWFLNAAGKLIDIRIDNAIRMGLTLRDQYVDAYKKAGENPQAFIENLKNARRGK